MITAPLNKEEIFSAALAISEEEVRAAFLESAFASGAETAGTFRAGVLRHARASAVAILHL